MPSEYSFTFGGVDFKEKYGIWIEETHDVLFPALRSRKVVVPDKSGAYDFGAKHYDERGVELTCISISKLTREQMRELAYDLSGKKQLVIWREPDKYYVGQIYDDEQIEYVGIVGSRYPLTFICEPFAYGRQVTERFTNESKLGYAGTARTPTRITITNNNAYPITGLSILMKEAVQT